MTEEENKNKMKKIDEEERKRENISKLNPHMGQSAYEKLYRKQRHLFA